MIVNCQFHHFFLLLIVLLASSCRGVDGTGIFDYVFGVGNQEERLRNFVEDFNVYYRDHVGGNSMARTVPQRQARDDGERGMRCVLYIIELDMDKWIPELPFVKGFVFERYYEAFANQEAIEKICSYTERLRGYRENPPRVKQFHERNLQSDAAYAAQTSARYAQWAANRVAPYIERQLGVDVDLTLRTAFTRVFDDILDIAATLRTVTNSLRFFKNGGDIACRAVGSFELGFDPGDFCAVVTEAVNFAAVSTNLALRAIEADKDYTDIHDAYIDSAEIQATTENLASLITR